MRMRSRPDIPRLNTLNSGVVSVIIHARESSSAMRESMASVIPMVRARARWWSGSRPTSTEMKMMLSMPSTISSAVSVTSAIQAFGSKSHSMVVFPDEIRVMRDYSVPSRLEEK